MHLTIFYRPNSEHATSTERYVDEFHGLHPDVPIELIDADSIDGSTSVELYDIVRYPSVIATSSDGQLLGMWMGVLPLMDDVLSRVIGYL